MRASKIFLPWKPYLNFKRLAFKFLFKLSSHDSTEIIVKYYPIYRRTILICNNFKIIFRSVLGQLLPEAMVAYLDNHGPEKFSTIFLGEYDTPEAIWCGEMRSLMIQKIAYHLADFTPRLQSNNRAIYQYCPIPIITYPTLEEDLFCDIYYLRYLKSLSEIGNIHFTGFNAKIEFLERKTSLFTLYHYSYR